MKLEKAIQYKINQICKEKEITISKLAELSCLTQSSVNNLINGHSKNPKTLTILRICDGLGIKLKDFYDDPIFDNIDRED